MNEAAQKIADRYHMRLYVYEGLVTNKQQPDRELLAIIVPTTDPGPAPDHGRFEIAAASKVD